MDTLMSILSKHTGKSDAQVREDCDRDHWLSAEEAVSYGVVDRVLKPGVR
jgi:ATP-dependent Clp protease protease subunit